MKISRKEYRKLIRNTERLMLLEEMAKKDTFIGRKEILMICGCDMEKKA